MASSNIPISFCATSRATTRPQNVQPPPLFPALPMLALRMAARPPYPFSDLDASASSPC